MYSCLRATRLHSNGVECADRPRPLGRQSPTEALHIEFDGSFEGQNSTEVI